jgi:hypothetical protein
MSRYRKIEVRTWSDEKFRVLSPVQPSGQGLWFFLLTGPHTGPIPGLFRAGRAAMAEELGWPLEAFDEAFREVFQQGMAKADFTARLMWLPNAIKHNKPESPNVVKSWAPEFDLLPECPLKLEALEAIKTFVCALGPGFSSAFAGAFESHGKPSGKASGKPSGKPSGKTMPNQEQEQEQEVKAMGDEPPVCSKAADPCPHQAIIDLYHEALPTGRQVRIWSDTRKAKLRARWKEDPTRQSLEWWGKFFSYVAESDFLTGKTASAGRRPFELGLEWIVSPENFAKILEGKYENAPTAPAVIARPADAMFKGVI